MELRDLVESDLGYVRAHDISKSKFTLPDERVDYAWTLTEEEQILAIGGIQKITSSCAWAWICMTDDAKRYKLTVFRTLREYTEQVCRNVGITRLQAWSEIDFEESKRLIEHLGFHKEGDPMVGFINEETDAQLYVKFFGDT